MSKVAQFDSQGVFSGEERTYGQGLPANTCKDFPDPDECKPLTKNGVHRVPVRSKDNTRWHYKEDHRGVTGLLDGKPITITELGPLPGNFKVDEVVEEEFRKLTLLELKEQKKAQVNKNRRAMFESGVWYKGFQFQSREIDRTNVEEVSNIIRDVGWVFGDNYTWRSTCDTDVPFNQIDVVSLRYTLLAQKQALYSLSWDEKDKIDTLRSRSQVEAFQLTMLDSKGVQEHLTDKVLETFLGPLREQKKKET